MPYAGVKAVENEWIMNLQNTVRRLVEWGLLAPGSNSVSQTKGVTANLKAPAVPVGTITEAAEQSELVALLGSAATAGAGAIRLAQNTSGDMYVCASDGAEWFAARMPIGTT